MIHNPQGALELKVWWKRL